MFCQKFYKRPCCVSKEYIGQAHFLIFQEGFNWKGIQIELSV